MKKITALLSIGLCFTVLSYGQQKLSKKEATKILEKAWNAVKASDTTEFIKLWYVDKAQWPYHGDKHLAQKK